MKCLGLLSLLLFISCGNPEKLWPVKTQATQKIEPAYPEEFSYELRTRTCSTGKHVFATFVQACEALKNNQLNNDCAFDKREELFVNSECSGAFI